MPVKTREIPGICTATLFSDGIVEITIYPGAKFDLNVCSQCTDLMKIMNDGYPRRYLFDYREVTEMPSVECRKYFQTPGYLKHQGPAALIVSENHNGIGVAFINWYSKFMRNFIPRVPQRVFISSKKDARTWLEDQNPINLFSEKDRRVLRGMLRSRSNREIAREIDVTEGYVSQYRQKIFDKLGTDNIVEITDMVKSSSFYPFFSSSG